MASQQHNYVQGCSSRRRHKITRASRDAGYAPDIRVRRFLCILHAKYHACTYERNVNERVCVCQNIQRGKERERERDEGQRERTKERDGVRARDNIVLERKAVEEGQREREMREHARQSRASSWPSCFKMSSAFVYIEENLLLRSGKLRKRERLSSFLSLSLSLAPLFFFYAARSFLILPFSPFVSFQLVRFSIFAIAAPSVQLLLAFSRC